MDKLFCYTCKGKDGLPGKYVKRTHDWAHVYHDTVKVDDLKAMLSRAKRAHMGEEVVPMWSDQQIVAWWEAVKELPAPRFGGGR